jgi:hypothetical protein
MVPSGDKPTALNCCELAIDETDPRHKDYLFFKLLATKLPIDSFRFDFRYVLKSILSVVPTHICLVHLRSSSGNNETPGSWTYGGLDRDITDISAVVDYLNSTYGYSVELLIGHSRGSITAFRWLSVSEKARTVSSFVNVSGRYRMSVSRTLAFPSVSD